MHMKYDNNLQNRTLVKDRWNALKLQIIHSLDEGYLFPLSPKALGYANITQSQIITYLKDTYGAVEHKDSMKLEIQYYHTALQLH